MGIKNIHIFLISAASILALGFGIWALTHNYVGLGYCSLASAVGLVIYGIQFVKKAKVL